MLSAACAESTAVPSATGTIGERRMGLSISSVAFLGRKGMGAAACAECSELARCSFAPTSATFAGSQQGQPPRTDDGQFGATQQQQQGGPSRDTQPLLRPDGPKEDYSKYAFYNVRRYRPYFDVDTKVGGHAGM